MSNDLAKFVPLNPVEFENELRSMILKHQGVTSGNPTQWVVNAVAEAFQRGFGLGFNAGMLAKPAPKPQMAFKVLPPAGVTLDHEAVRAIGGRTARSTDDGTVEDAMTYDPDRDDPRPGGPTLLGGK